MFSLKLTSLLELLVVWVLLMIYMCSFSSPSQHTSGPTIWGLVVEILSYIYLKNQNWCIFDIWLFVIDNWLFTKAVISFIPDTSCFFALQVATKRSVPSPPHKCQKWPPAPSLTTASWAACPRWTTLRTRLLKFSGMSTIPRHNLVRLPCIREAFNRKWHSNQDPVTYRVPV